MEKDLKKRIRVLIWFFIIGLVISGVTAFPLEWELKIINDLSSDYLTEENPLKNWIEKVYEGIKITNNTYPFISYGTDWLAFAHIVIGIAFIGPLKDPVRNIWVIEFGIIACILIFPLAFIAGAIRNIPFYWQLIDCSFGAIGLVPLVMTHKLIKRLETYEKNKRHA